MFETLNERLEKIVSSIRGKAVISESDLDTTMREIRISLLEADVALSVVKSFVDNIKSNILGKEVLKSIKPDQMIIKLVQDELIKILGDNNEPLNIQKNSLTKILFCGLQGSGKTTTVAKIANDIKKNSKKKILLVSVDIYRPAAQEQLKVLANQIDVDFYDSKNSDSVNNILSESLNFAEKNLVDIILLDTAGRQVIDEAMMKELKDINEFFSPNETLLVADSLTGPISRGDISTVEKHIEALQENAKSILPLYKSLASGALAIASQSNDINQSSKKSLMTLLDDHI